MTQADGEKELVLGNKQLISLFFVVVALCGVFFAMGYMIGRKTSAPVTANLDANAPAVVASPSPVPRSQESEPPRETAGEEPPASSPAPAESQPPAPAPSASTQTQAAHDTPVTSAPSPGAPPAVSAASPDTSG